MKKVIYSFSLIVISLSLNACFSSSVEENPLTKIIPPVVEYDAVEVEGLYSMKIPKFMTSATGLHEEASLQYSNPFKEKYITVLDESKEETMAFMTDFGVFDESKSKLENYVDTRLGFLAESGILISNQTKLKSETINGRRAYSTIVEGKLPEITEEIAYFFTYIEGKDHFYMISSWTLLSRKDAYTEEAIEMAKSFKEL